MDQPHTADPVVAEQLKLLTTRMAATEDMVREAVSRSARVLDRPTIAKMMYSARRDRDLFFDSDLFGEPAWDLLLDLYIAYSEDRLISISSAGIAACAAPTTSLRWINALVERGLIARRDHQFDRRVSYVALTDRGIASMEQLLDRYLSRTLEQSGFLGR